MSDEYAKKYPNDIGKRKKVPKGWQVIKDYGPSLTQQHEAHKTDINKIIEKYDTTGILSHVNKAEPIFSEELVQMDYKQSLDMIRRAESAFMELPANVRNKFGNDPSKYIEYLRRPQDAGKTFTEDVLESEKVKPAPPPPPPEDPPVDTGGEGTT